MTERSSEGLNERRKRLLFRAWRRGVRETDLIVSAALPIVYIDKFDTGALDDFERLIEVPNAELYSWVSGEAVAPADPQHRRAAATSRSFRSNTDARKSGNGANACTIACTISSEAAQAPASR